MSEARKSRSKRSSAWAKRTVFGTHSHQILAALFRYGAADRVQLSRIAGISGDAVKRQVRHLRDSRLIAVVDDMDGRTAGRPKSIYHLTANGVKAGARTLGIENAPAARDHYSRVDAPRAVTHRLRANEYLLALAEAASSDAGVEMPADDVWSESYPSFPLFGSRRLSSSEKMNVSEKKRSPKPRWLRIAPDGTFVLAFSEVSSEQRSEQRFFLEYESGLRESEVKDKARRYLSRWRRILHPDNGSELRWHDPSARVEPVVVITSTARHADRLSEVLYEAMPAAESWEPLVEALGARATGVVDPRQLILLASWEQVNEDPLGRVYRPSREYPRELGGWDVSLADAARIASRATPPPAKEVKERLKAEAEAAAEEREAKKKEVAS